MAEDLVLTAISNLTSLYQDELNLSQSFDTERKKLESNLSTLKLVLHDAEKKQLANKSDVLNNWLLKLKDIFYELDDVVDDCLIEDMRDEFEGDRSCAFLGFLHPQKVMFRHSIIQRMKAITERLDVIAQEKDQFNFFPAESQTETRLSNIPQWRETTPRVTENEIFGREQDKQIIVHHLLEDARTADNLYVYPIVGLGGLGKTTLAQLVYGDKRVKEHFQLMKWICVSENFDLKTLLKAIIKSKESLEDLDELVEKLQDILQGKRYLIVLDDVWNESREKWMELRSLLACGAKGSAVLVTTRLEKVAMIMRSPPALQPYQLSFLTDDDCWQVFRKRAFGSSFVQETQILVSIGRDIARKCKGVPLAAKTLGGLLMFQADERFWNKIRDSELWTILPEEEEGSILAALRLSYLNLSPRTRRCFSICSIFPKDYIIKKMELIHLWMANGLISQEPNMKWELEDIGDMVVNDLYWRSLIQDIKRDDDESGSISSFKMHDLVHDLAQSVSSHESDAVEEPSSADLSSGTRHLSITCDEDEIHNACNLLGKVESLRSLVFCMSFGYQVDLVISHSLKHTKLRALDISGYGLWLKELPSSIAVLKHLRYLNLANCAIMELPDSIGCLWNLQTLNVSHCLYLKTFPASIGHLKNLQHLYNEECRNLSSMPQSMVGLTSLRTLSRVVLCEPDQKDQLQLSGLEHLKNLRGQLEIRNLVLVKDVKDVGKVNLNERQDLHDLRLIWRVIYLWDDSNDEQQQIQILEALRPPQRLRKLTLNGYNGMSFPDWMMNEIANFTHIQSLKLRNCTRCTQLPPLWRLPSLKDLELTYLRDLGEEAEPELNNKNGIIYPQLSNLKINGCPKLKSFTPGALPALRSLFLDHSESFMLSILNSSSNNLQSFKSLEDLTISDCNSLEFFPNRMFLGVTSLAKLSIVRCSKLICLPESIKSLSSLVELTIFRCPKLKVISSFIVQLASLRVLQLRYLNLESLDTDTLTDLPTLKYLRIEYCKCLQALPNWMTHLSSLEKLKLVSCPRLTSIPDSIQQLPNLKDLSITSCPELPERCNEETGQDWHKISDIPNLYIWE